MHLVGIVFMCVLNLYRRKQYKIGAMHAVITALLSAVSGFIGAKLLYILENIQQILVSGIQFGGVSFFGALFIIPAAVWMIQKLLRIHNPLFLDYCVPSALLMLGMIRIGCFLNGCCSGIHLTVNGNYCVVPVQLLECGFDFLILAYMLYSEIHHIYTGKHYPLLLLGYGTVRFLLEFLRSTPKVWIGFSNGQCFALLAIAVGMILWQSKKQV
jgi:phosphatidylglycerol:prolipoprotein diacylglycerol transferase